VSGLSMCFVLIIILMLMHVHVCAVFNRVTVIGELIDVPHVENETRITRFHQYLRMVFKVSHVCVCVRVSIYRGTCASVHVNKYIYICVCVCVCVRQEW
jgi:hypothetical protein